MDEKLTKMFDSLLRVTRIGSTRHASPRGSETDPEGHTILASAEEHQATEIPSTLPGGIETSETKQLRRVIAGPGNQC